MLGYVGSEGDTLLAQVTVGHQGTTEAEAAGWDFWPTPSFRCLLSCFLASQTGGSGLLSMPCPLCFPVTERWKASSLYFLCQISLKELTTLSASTCISHSHKHTRSDQQIGFCVAFMDYNPLPQTFLSFIYFALTKLSLLLCSSDGFKHVC